MHARVVADQVRAGKTDDWLALIRDSVVPSRQEPDGWPRLAGLQQATR